MKITNKELAKYFKTPYTSHDYFAIELLDAAIYYMENILHEIESQVDVKFDTNKIRFDVLEDFSKFHLHCINCDEDCINNYTRRIDKDAYLKLGIDEAILPGKLKRKSKGNYFILHYITMLAQSIVEAIDDEDEQFSHEMRMMIFDCLVDFTVISCLTDCGMKCFRDSHPYPYCTICEHLDEPLPCVLKGETTIEDINEDWFPDHCKRDYQ